MPGLFVPPPPPLADDPRARVAGLILAGGLGRRVGGQPKGLLELSGTPLIVHVARALAPQVGPLLINANGPAETYAGLGLPVVADDLPDHPGPLAGILAGLDHVAAHFHGVERMVSVPVDSPFLPTDLVARFLAREASAPARARGRPVIHARSGGRDHPVVALWPVAMRHDLRAFLASGARKVGRMLDESGALAEEWMVNPADPFFNINTLYDLSEATAQFRARG